MVFQNYFAEMPTPEENLAAKQEELKAKVEEYNATQQTQQGKLQELIKLQGAVEALQEVVTHSEEG